MGYSFMIPIIYTQLFLVTISLLILTTTTPEYYQSKMAKDLLRLYLNQTFNRLF